MPALPVISYKIFNLKLDILVIAAHPDDAELGCSGTILTHIKAGRTVGIIDLTRGELGTRGTPELRQEESIAASALMGIHARENLGFRDGFFVNDEHHQLRIVEMIRKYQPEIVLMNAFHDRHPDHGKGSAVASDACFISGLRRVETSLNGMAQQPWRPKVVYHYIQDYYIKPDFIVDISSVMDQKTEIIKAFKSQFYDPESTEPETVLTSPGFFERNRARAREYGKAGDVEYGEGFTVERMIGVRDLFDLI